MSSLFDTGIRPHVDAYLQKLSEEKRDYGQYWSASSAGYCMRKVIYDRLGVPPVKVDARKTRVFESGHIFHEWMQRVTRDAGISIAQEIELQDEELMIRGHFDDLVLVEDAESVADGILMKPRLILYDYKTVNSRAFSYKKDKMSHYHRMQLGTYMYMLRKTNHKTTLSIVQPGTIEFKSMSDMVKNLSEARIMNISKDDLRMSEAQLLWTPDLEKDVVGYWRTLNGYWKKRQLPRCTCADNEGGFMAREAYNPFYWEGEPCSLELLKLKIKEGAISWPS